MISPKLLLSLMVLAGTQSAPQINERQVVGDVLAQLQPAITRALNSVGGGGSGGFGGSRGAGGFSRGGSSFSGGFSAPSRSSSFSSTPITRFTPSSFSSAPRTPSFSSSGPNINSVTSSVVSSLQPSIAAAVAQALAGSRGSQRGGVSNGDESEGPAKYDYSYKVADDERQSYIAHQESRDNDMVTGSYNYVDPTGSLVTVNYQAGPDGFEQTRDVQKGAVTINPENIPGPYNGPLAGIDDVPSGGSGTISGRRPSAGLSQSDLIAQILASIQPQISSAVQGAISSNSGASRASSGFSNGFSVSPRVARPVAPRVSSTPITRFNPSSFSSAPRTPSFSSSGSGFGSSQGGLVRNIISSLQPRISSAVNSAISSSRPAPRSRASFARPSSQASAGGNLAGLFGNGGNSFRLETPNVAIQY